MEFTPLKTYQFLQLKNLSNMKTQINLNDFLTEQEKPSYLCIIETIKDSPNKINLIRWIESRKMCNPSQSVIIDKDMIDCIYPTEYFYFFGNNKHTVVEVVFKADATVPLTDFVELAWRKKKQRAKTIEEILESL